jgi:regulator of replication initiation timing
MVDLSLEEFQRNQSIRISRDIIGQSEEHEQKMQTNSQKLWENAHKQLVALLRLLDQDYDESCEKANHPLEKFNDDDLAYLIHVRLRAMQGDASKKVKQNDTLEVKRSLNELSQKYTELEQRLLILQETNQRLQAEKAALDAHLSALRQVQKDAVDQNVQAPKPITDNLGDLYNRNPIPDWMKTWRESRVFEKTSTAILVMGETGMALRPSIIKIMAMRLSLSVANKNLDESLNCLMTPEEEAYPILIEEVDGIPKEGSSSGGNPPDVLHLTEHGKVAYQALTGRVPKENEYDKLVRRHSSPEHTILNIQAAEILVEEGFQLRGQAQEIQLVNGDTLIPDIISADPKTGEVIFIEVERDVNKDQMSRKQKWMKLYEASNGNLYVFCDNLNCQRAIQGEINLALGGLVYNSFLTNLHGLRKGKRSEKDGSIWFSQRRGKYIE